jgi:hypothetical protein
MLEKLNSALKKADPANTAAIGAGWLSPRSTRRERKLLHTLLNVYTIRFTFERFKPDGGKSLRLTVARASAARLAGRAAVFRWRAFVGRGLWMHRPPVVSLPAFIKRTSDVSRAARRCGDLAQRANFVPSH